MLTFKTTPYTLPFNIPLNINGQEILKRDGIVVTATSSDELTGSGEIAPLRGLHLETWAEAKKQLEVLIPRLSKITIESIEDIETALQKFKLYPSVRCGVELALFELLAKKKQCSLEQLLNPAPLKTVPVNALIPGNIAGEELQTLLTKLISKKYSCVKLKCSQLSLEEDMERVKLTVKLLPYSMQCRLDANQNWSLAQFETFIKGIDLSRIEYIEEPLKDFRQIVGAGHDLPAHLSIIDRGKWTAKYFGNRIIAPVALDESLAKLDPKKFTPPPYVKALVLKPMILGGIITTLKWVKLAKKHRIKVVISSCYESPEGIAQLSKLALAVHQDGVAAGLDTEYLTKKIKKHESSSAYF